MDEARLVDAVLDPHPKGLADLGDEAEGAVRLTDGEYGGCLAVHLDVAPLELEDGRLRAACDRRASRARSAPRRRSETRPGLRPPRGERDGTAWEASSNGSPDLGNSAG